MRPFIFYTLTLLISLWLQVLVNALTGGWPVGVNGLLILTLFFGLVRGPAAGQLLGLGWGLLIDASALGPMGLHGLLLAIAGYGAGIFRRQLDGTKSWTQTIFTGVISLLYGLAFTGLDHLLSRSPRSLTAAVALEPLVNALAAPLLFSLMRVWADLWRIEPAEYP